jgi:hypothetical protein
MSGTARKINKILLILGGILLLGILVMGFISTAVNWQGVCDIEGEGQVSCSWLQFALREIFWGIFIFIPFFLIAALINIGILLYQLIGSVATKIRMRK